MHKNKDNYNIKKGKYQDLLYKDKQQIYIHLAPFLLHFQPLQKLNGSCKQATKSSTIVSKN